MANKKLLVRMLVMALAFGMAVVGCGNGTTNNNGLPENINTGNPETSDLTAYKLPANFFTAIDTAAGGGYQGWYIDYDDQLQFFWTGRDETQCDAVLDAITVGVSGLAYIDATETVNVSEKEEGGKGTMRSGNGAYEFGAWRYSVVFAITDCFAWGQDIPQGMLVANFWKEEE